MNKLWLIYVHKNNAKDRIYDCYDGFVISAPNTYIVRFTASQNAADEGKATWIYPKYSKIKYLGRTNKKQGIILGSFNAG